MTVEETPLASTDNAPRIFTPAYYSRLEEIEASHWWYRGLRSLIARWLAQTDPGERLRILDVGCGAGFMLRWFETYARGGIVVGVDFDPRALVCARGHGRGIVAQASAMQLPFANARFDLVNCADVLQHLPTANGAAEALAEIARVLAPRGLVILRTNAAPGLGDTRDSDYQRYRLNDLEQQVRTAGLTVLRSTHVNVVPSILATLRGQGHAASHHAETSHVRQHGPGVPRLPRVPGVNAAMTALLYGEAMLLSRPGVSSPFGHSAMLLAQRS